MLETRGRQLAGVDRVSFRRRFGFCIHCSLFWKGNELIVDHGDCFHGQLFVFCFLSVHAFKDWIPLTYTRGLTLCPAAFHGTEPFLALALRSVECAEFVPFVFSKERMISF